MSGRHEARVRLGASSVEVTRLGLGASSLGGLFEPVGDDEARAVVAAALRGGVTYLDTAPLYGRGLSERRVGTALAEVPRSTFTLSTKVGRLVRAEGAPCPDRPEPGMWPEAPPGVTVRDYGYDGIRRSLEESLERLGLDAVDIAYVHDPDDHIDEAIGAAAPALERLRDEGFVRAYGFGMNAAAPLVRAVHETSLDCVLVAGRMTLLDSSACDELLPLCLEREVGVVVGGVFNSGVLARPLAGARYDYAPASAEVLARARRLADACASHGVPLHAAALQYPLRHEAVTAVLAGVRSVAELEEAIEAFDRELPADLWPELEAEGAAAPVGDRT